MATFKADNELALNTGLNEHGLTNEEDDDTTTAEIDTETDFTWLIGR
jgi:hypothetical protein